MDKYLKLIVLVFIAIIVVSIVSVCLFAKSAFATPVGILDGVTYDMTPKDLENAIGTPNNVADYMDLSAETVYSYTVDVDGIPTQMSFSFQDGKKLASVDAYVAADGEIDSDAIFENWRSKLYAEYQDEKNFFCKELHKNSDTDYGIELGIQNGATGIFCSVSVDESGVHLSCVNMK